MPSYTRETVIRAPRKDVYELFVDRESHGNYLPLSTRLITAGSPDRSGVGSVVFLGAGPIGAKEETIELQPNTLIRYRVIGGLPVKNHIGTFTFADAPEGTLVTYTMASEPKVPVPAAVTRGVLAAAVTGYLAALKRAAERR